MTLSATAVRFEHHEPGRFGIGESRPRLSWKLTGDASTAAGAALVQLAARLEVTVAAPGATPRTEVVERPGADQVLVAWPIAPLVSRERADVRVQVLSADGWSEWSETGTVTVGLLERGDWLASFVGDDDDAQAESTEERRPTRIRTEIDLPVDIVDARVYTTAHGVVELEINGARVGDEELTPGWTSYGERLRYAAFDVTDLVSPGPNALGAWLGDGWWRGRFGFEGGKRNIYGSDQSALVQLEVTTVDGERHTYSTDASWTVAASPVLESSLYDGERFDARLDAPGVGAGWSRVGGGAPGESETTQWRPVRVIAADPSILVAPDGPPVRCTEELHPVSVVDLGDGRHLLDFGQNHTGRLRIRGTGAAGAEIGLRHAEVLQDGQLYTRTLRQAAAHDVLTLAGGSFEWEPRFTIHGYRYAEVSGWSGPLEPGAVVSRVLHSDMPRTGWFSSSHAGVDRLHENALWSLRSNFVDIPTDCPQRDERLGWTGDLQVFTPTASFLYDVAGMLSGWLRDVAVEQRIFGFVPFFVPYIELPFWSELPTDPTAIWGDVAVLTPDVLHSRFADTEVLRRQCTSAVTWLEHVEEKAGADRICDGTLQLGDWLDPTAPPDNPMEAQTSPALVATAYFAHSARRLSAIAAIIGETADAARFDALADEVAAAFVGRYLDADGRLVEDTQTAHALALRFGLLPDAASNAAAGIRLAELVRAADGRIATGFAGTPMVSDALSGSGHLAEAYQLLEAEENPSWLYTVAMGATTIWERWDSMLPDGTVNPGDMTSFNHYALGSVADWLHRVVAGIEAVEPGYRRIRFAPRPGGTITHASAAHETPYGRAGIAWELVDEGSLRAEVTVPFGATAEVELPGAAAVELGPGTHTLMG